MNKLILLGILITVVLVIALMPYLKWLLLLLAFKLIIELVIKFRSSSSSREKFKMESPIKGTRMRVDKIANRVEQGFDTPKIPLSKVVFIVLGIFILIVAGKGLLNMLVGFFENFKYLLIALGLLLILLLISRAKNGRPITITKVLRRVNSLRPDGDRHSDRREDRYEERYEDNYSDRREDRYEDRREDRYEDRYEDNVCLRCRHSRTCDENRRRNCSELNGRYNREDNRQSRNKRMEYM